MFDYNHRKQTLQVKHQYPTVNALTNGVTEIKDTIGNNYTWLCLHTLRSLNQHSVIKGFKVIYQHDIILDVWCILLLTYITIHYMKIKVCQKQLYTSRIAWPHLWAALMCLPNSSCLLSSHPCVSGDWTASGTLHAILYLTFTPPPNTSLMVTDQGDAICPDQSIPWPYKSLS